MSPSELAERMARAAVLLVVASLLLGPQGVFAQEPSADEAAEQTAESAEVEADETDQEEGGEEPSGEADEGDEGDEGDEMPEGAESVLAELLDDHAVGEDQVSSVQRTQKLEEAATRELARMRIELEEANARLSRIETSSVVLDEQLADSDLPEEARVSLARRGGLAAARLQVHRAMAEWLRERIAKDERLLELLTERTKQLRQVEQKAIERAEKRQERLEQAEAAERAALAEVERARAREAQERDVEVRELISQRREILEKTARVAREQGEQIQEAGRERSERVDTFARRRGRLDGDIQGFPAAPSASFSREEVDPVFDQVLTHRRELRQAWLRHRDQVEDAREMMAKAEERLEDASTELARAQHSLKELGDSVVGEQKVALAQARVEFRSRQLEAARDLAGARNKQLDLATEQLAYYDDVIADLLPRISSQRRGEFYSLLRDANWESAWFGVRQAAWRTTEILEQRAEQFFGLSDKLISVSLWGWVFGLFWRILLLALVIFFGRDYTDPAIRKLTSLALGRRFFRRRASLTIKGAEVLRSIVRPAVLYLLLDALLSYVVEAFAELVFLSWALDAFFVFWIGMTLVKVLILPRRYRESSLRTPAPDLSRLGGDATRASLTAVDLIDLELSRARKLVLSIRIVLIFWLLHHYVPLATISLLGHSVITWIVERGFTWGLIIVVYMVLSTWKDDIAAVFERLAKERLPRAVEFVNQHKDRFYGVLVIALASVYVAARELAKFMRSQAKDTEWSKKLSNFVFRKRIELQQREREEEALGRTGERLGLPEEYVALFEAEPVDREDFRVRRRAPVEEAVEAVEQWREDLLQGSLAISGEQGIGRTSLVNQIVREIEREYPKFEVRRNELTDKLKDRQRVFDWITDLFDLGDVFESREELVNALRELPPRIIVIDDCQHLFVREIGGFEGLDSFLEIVSMTDEIHFWMLTFNKFAWNYINRVHPRQHYFGTVHELDTWSEEEIKELIERRNLLSERKISFTDLIVTEDQGEDDFYEVIKTSNGYFRLLREFSKGNPRVALRYWRRSIKIDQEGTVQVSLFRKPSMRPIEQLEDEYLFVLAAIAQHGALDAAELAEITNSQFAFCEMALNYFDERDVVDMVGRRAVISPLYFRQVVNKLVASNFLWD
jgi:hypothetical protein